MICHTGVVRRISSSRIFLLPAICMIVGVFSSVADSSLQEPAGSFRRNDGVELAIVRCYTNRYSSTGPANLRFQAPDGTLVAQTEPAGNNVIQGTPSNSIVIYQFNRTFLPVADRIQCFDGYTLVDVTASSTIWHTVIIHTASHWWNYLLALLISAMLVGAWIVTKAIPSRDWLSAVRAFGFCFIGLSWMVFLLKLLSWPPISPPVFFVVFLACLLPILLLRWIWRLFQKTSPSPPSRVDTHP